LIKPESQAKTPAEEENPASVVILISVTSLKDQAAICNKAGAHSVFPRAFSPALIGRHPDTIKPAGF
jgi:hypothetical protein